MIRNLILIVLVFIISPVCAQTDEFRVLGGVPHLPVFSGTGDITSPAAGMLIYSIADAKPMLYSGSAWEDLCTTSGPDLGVSTFQVVDKIPYLPTQTSLSVAPTSGSMYYSSSDNSIKVYDGSAWINVADLTNGSYTLQNGFSAIKEIIRLPVLSLDPIPTGLGAGALYVSSADKALKYFDGSAWKLLSCSAPTLLTGVINGQGGSTMKFLSHNLGADTNLDPFAWKDDGDLIDHDIKGYFYQWGRQNDGHQLRGSPYRNTTTTTDTPSHGDFLLDGSHPFDWRKPQNDDLWGGIKTVTDPCPAGYRVPTREEWQDAYDNNTWTWTGNGYEIDADGDGSPELYLPAAGLRSSSDGAPISDVGIKGIYWASTVDDYRASVIFFNSSGIYPAVASHRMAGSSVRCVAE